MACKKIIGLLIICLSSIGSTRNTRQNVNTHAAGGEFVEISNHPYQVSLQYSFYGHVCGGAIISEEWVLTTARCVVQFADEKLYVSVGRKSLDDNDPIKHDVLDVYMHEDFDNSPLPNYDIALLKVERLEFGDNINSVLLSDVATEPLIRPYRCNLTGWGAREPGGYIPWDLQVLDQRTLNFDVCNCSYVLLTGSQVSLAPSTLCATNSPPLANNTGPCMGDWGNPLVCEVDNEIYLMGLLSGDPLLCGEVPIPNLYTKVSSYLDWINDIIENDNTHKSLNKK